jgi:hypothetical protein
MVLKKVLSHREESFEPLRAPQASGERFGSHGNVKVDQESLR